MGSKAVWNFSENSSDLVAGPFSKRDVFLSCPRAIPAIITSSKRDLKKAVKFRVEQLSAFYQDNARLLLRYKLYRDATLYKDAIYTGMQYFTDKMQDPCGVNQEFGSTWTGQRQDHKSQYLHI